MIIYLRMHGIYQEGHWDLYNVGQFRCGGWKLKSVQKTKHSYASGIKENLDD